MKLKKIIMVASLVCSPSILFAEVSGNAGYVSDYLYRGIYQSGSSASAGIDFEESGLYVGTWVADVGKALEFDLYGGYAVELGDLGLSVGFTGYYYTQDWDDTYEEINLGMSYGSFSFDYADGEWDGFGTPADYEFASIGYSLDNGLGFAYGAFAGNGGDYVEISYGFDLAGIDAFVALTLGDDTNTHDALVLGFGRGFTIVE
jgi:uncharacterized protein (TIGR02001 family)